MKLLIASLSLFILSCSHSENVKSIGPYFQDEIMKLSATEIERIEYYDTGGNYFDGRKLKNPDYSVTDSSKIAAIVQGINTSSNAGMWKGTGWDIISVVTKDTIIQLTTDGKVVGQGASGRFFSFQDTNFVKTYFE